MADSIKEGFMKKLLFALMLLVSPMAFGQSVPLSAFGTAIGGFNEVFKTPLVTIPSWAAQHKLYIFNAMAVNGSGGNEDIAYVTKMADAGWKWATITAASTPDATDDTTDAQDVGAGDMSLYTTTNNDGWLACATRQFNIIGFTVSQADGGGAVYAYKYYNGSSMATLTTLHIPANYSSTGDKVHVFYAPSDWAKGTTSGVSTSLGSYYCIEGIASTAPAQATLGTIAWLGQANAVDFDVPDTVQSTFNPSVPLELGANDTFGCYFETANASNACSALWGAK